MNRALILGFIVACSATCTAQSPDQAAFQRNLQWAQSGVVTAELTVGRDYLRGSVIARDFTASHQWFETASRAGSVDANAWLAIMTIRGQGVPQDEKGGLQLLQTAVASGSAKAKTFLGQIYESGKLVPKDTSKAVQLYRDAVSTGDADAMAGLGNLYLRGDGIPPNQSEGEKMLEMSVALGNEWGEVFLAHTLITTATNEAGQERGLRLLKASAAQKNPEALFELGNLSEEGKLVPRDPKAAIKYYRQAARQDFVPAERELAAVFASGLGINQDNRAAYFWATLAAAQGDIKSIKRAESIKPQLTTAELAEIKQRVIEFRRLRHPIE